MRPGKCSVEGQLDPCLGLGVEGAGAVVEEQDGGLGHDRAGQGQALPLSARKRITAFADRCIQPAWQRRDRLGEIGDQKGFSHLVFGRVGVGIEQIGADRSLEEKRLLGHQRHGPSEVGQLEVADIVAVKVDGSPGVAAGVGSLGNVIKARGQCHQGRLARAAFAEHAQAHPRLDP